MVNLTIYVYKNTIYVKYKGSDSNIYGFIEPLFVVLRRIFSYKLFESLRFFTEQSKNSRNSVSNNLSYLSSIFQGFLHNMSDLMNESMHMEMEVVMPVQLSLYSRRLYFFQVSSKPMLRRTVKFGPSSSNIQSKSSIVSIQTYKGSSLIRSNFESQISIQEGSFSVNSSRNYLYNRGLSSS